MAKIFKFNGYAVDPNEQTDSEEIKIMIEDYADCIVHHYHCEEAEFEWDDDNPLNYDNCDLAECEKYFANKVTIVDGTLASRLALVKPRTVWKHFKTGKLVKVIDIAQDTENPGNYSVVYICTSDDPNKHKVWYRPLDMFLSEVDRKRYPDAEQKYRFELVGDEE